MSDRPRRRERKRKVPFEEACASEEPKRKCRPPAASEEERRERKRETDRRYGSSNKGKACRRRYRSSNEGKARYRRFEASDKGKARRGRFKSSPKYQASCLRSAEKRARKIAEAGTDGKAARAAQLDAAKANARFSSAIAVVVAPEHAPAAEASYLRGELPVLTAPGQTRALGHLNPAEIVEQVKEFLMMKGIAALAVTSAKCSSLKHVDAARQAIEKAFATDAVKEAFPSGGEPTVLLYNSRKLGGYREDGHANKIQAGYDYITDLAAGRKPPDARATIPHHPDYYVAGRETRAAEEAH